MRDFLKSIGAKILIGAAVVLIGLMIYAASVGGFSSFPATVTGVIITPIQNLWSDITEGISGFFDDLTADSNQIDRLQQEIDQLRQQQVDYEKLKQENQFYKDYLEIKENNPDFRFAAGEVIASDPFDAYHNFTINAGSLDEVQPGDPVITSQGLVGMVYEVGPTWAKVRTILDPSLQVSAKINRTSENCVTSGSVSLAQEGKLRVELLPRRCDAQEGDLLVTSGISELYPAGLLIGSVSDIAPSSDGISSQATVTPFADFSSLSSVLVILSFDGQGGTQ